jgi:hypothetical protein
MELLKRSCCPTLVSEISSCTWDFDSGVFTTQWELDDNKHLEELEKAAWFKDAFEDLGLAANGGPKCLTSLPETLFDLNGERSIKTIHLCHESWLPSAGGTPPP